VSFGPNGAGTARPAKNGTRMGVPSSPFHEGSPRTTRRRDRRAVGLDSVVRPYWRKINGPLSLGAVARRLLRCPACRSSAVLTRFPQGRPKRLPRLARTPRARNSRPAVGHGGTASTSHPDGERTDKRGRNIDGSSSEPSAGWPRWEMRGRGRVLYSGRNVYKRRDPAHPRGPGMGVVIAFSFFFRRFAGLLGSPDWS